MAALTQENLIRFFESHNKPCPICESDEFGASDINQPIVNGMIDVDGNYNIPPPAILSYVLVCKKCGFMRHHRAEEVNAWIEAQDE